MKVSKSKIFIEYKLITSSDESSDEVYYTPVPLERYYN